MYGTIEVLGMISYVMNIGEYDRRITIITKDIGKIHAFARGARKSTSSFVASTRLFAFGKFTLYEGKESYNLQSTQINNYFDKISCDIENTCYGTYFLELANYYAKEFLKEPNLLKLLYYTLLAIINPNIPNELVRRIFELRAMVIFGQYHSELVNASSTCKYTWNYIINSRIEDLFKFNLTKNILEELSIYVDCNIKEFIDSEMKSLEILKLIS